MFKCATVKCIKMLKKLIIEFTAYSLLVYKMHKFGSIHTCSWCCSYKI